MPKEIGPREKALREQREARIEENERQQRESLRILKARVAVASQKRGKPRKAKK